MKDPSYSKMYAAAFNIAMSYAITDDCKVNTLATGVAAVIPLSLTYGRYFYCNNNENSWPLGYDEIRDQWDAEYSFN